MIVITMDENVALSALEPMFREYLHVKISKAVDTVVEACKISKEEAIAVIGKLAEKRRLFYGPEKTIMRP